jgi:hypothetical protein
MLRARSVPLNVSATSPSSCRHHRRPPAKRVRSSEGKRKDVARRGDSWIAPIPAVEPALTRSPNRTFRDWADIAASDMLEVAASTEPGCEAARSVERLLL